MNLIIKYCGEKISFFSENVLFFLFRTTFYFAHVRFLLEEDSFFLLLLTLENKLMFTVALLVKVDRRKACFVDYRVFRKKISHITSFKYKKRRKKSIRFSQGKMYENTQRFFRCYSIIFKEKGFFHQLITVWSLYDNESHQRPF